jgi:hypothetical protein
VIRSKLPFRFPFYSHEYVHFSVVLKPAATFFASPPQIQILHFGCFLTGKVYKRLFQGLRLFARPKVCMRAFHEYFTGEIA